MKKDFDQWNEVKKKTNVERPRFYTVREIWWCRLGVNVGTEQDGSGEKFLRPVVIMNGFGPEACLIIPLTTSTREHSLRVPIGLVEGQQARANISQIRVVDTRRLVEKVGFLEEKVFLELRKTARDILSGGLSDILPLAGVRPKPTVITMILLSNKKSISKVGIAAALAASAAVLLTLPAPLARASTVNSSSSINLSSGLVGLPAPASASAGGQAGYSTFDGKDTNWTSATITTTS